MWFLKDVLLQAGRQLYKYVFAFVTFCEHKHAHAHMYAHTHTHSQLVLRILWVTALLLVTFPIIHCKLFSMLFNTCISYLLPLRQPQSITDIQQ